VRSPSRKESLRSHAGILCGVYPEPLRCHPEPIRFPQGKLREGSAVGSGTGQNGRFSAEFTVIEMTRILLPHGRRPADLTRWAASG
jgi:hypothetical protein